MTFPGIFGALSDFFFKSLRTGIERHNEEQRNLTCSIEQTLTQLNKGHFVFSVGEGTARYYPETKTLDIYGFPDNYLTESDEIERMLLAIIDGARVGGAKTVILDDPRGGELDEWAFFMRELDFVGPTEWRYWTYTIPPPTDVSIPID